MSNHFRSENPREHREVSDLIPWYVNQTLNERDWQQVDDHAATCPECREDLIVQNRIFAGIQARRAQLRAVRLAQALAGRPR